LPRHLAVLAAKALRRYRQGELLPFLLGRLRVLGEARAILRHRRRLAAMTGTKPDWRIDQRFGNPTA
jgi:hypothetical protein